MFDSKEGRSERKSFIAGAISGIAVMVVLGGVFVLGATFGGGSIFGINNPGTGTPTQPTNPTQPGSEGNFAALAAVSNDDHIRGDEDAKITMIEFSDFECPFCARFHPTVKQILDEYEGDVRVVYRHFPLRSIHPMAQKAAEASECAADQGKFWEMHDKLFDLNSAGTLTLEGMKGAAQQLGLNTSSFNNCLDSGEMAAAVDEDYNDGLAGGVSGTPGTFVNGQYLAGALPYEQVKAIIDQLL